MLSRALSFLPTLAGGRFLLLAKMLLDELIHSLERQGVDFVDVDLDLVWVSLQRFGHGSKGCDELVSERASLCVGLGTKYTR